MHERAYWIWKADTGRLALAIAFSAGAHAAVLANAAFAPGLIEVALFAAGRPIEARLAALPAPAADAASKADSPATVRERAARPAQAASERPADRTEGPAGLPMAEFYFRGSELDERAIPLNQVDVDYPPAALASGVSGVVKLRLLIDRAGVLREASVIEAQPAGVFEDAALEAVHALRFRPAIRQGIAVGSVKLIEVPFYPDCTRTGSCNE